MLLSDLTELAVAVPILLKFGDLFAI